MFSGYGCYVSSPLAQNIHGTCAKARSEDMSSYSEGQTHLLMEALETKKWLANDLTLLGQAKPEVHQGIRDLLSGRAKIVYPQHLIDCDATPFCPEGWSVESHWQSGQLEWNPIKVQLYLSNKQVGSKVIEGNKLRKELAGKNVLNANVLDYLLKHPELIPDEYKGKAVFFWGTIYRNADGGLFVRYLYWVGSQWHWYCSWLGYGFSDGGPAAVLSK